MNFPGLNFVKIVLPSNFPINICPRHRKSVSRRVRIEDWWVVCAQFRWRRLLVTVHSIAVHTHDHSRAELLAGTMPAWEGSPCMSPCSDPNVTPNPSRYPAVIPWAANSPNCPTYLGSPCLPQTTETRRQRTMSLKFERFPLFCQAADRRLHRRTRRTSIFCKNLTTPLSLMFPQVRS